jgi:hypothetical protein
VLKTYAFGENEGVGREYGVASLKISNWSGHQKNGMKIS